MNNNADELPTSCTTAIQVSLARIEEQQKAGNHRIGNVDFKIDALALKLEKYVEKSDLEPLATRVSDIENTMRWVTRALLAGMAGIVAGVYFLGRKIGLGP